MASKYIHYLAPMETWTSELVFSGNTSTDVQKVTCPVCIFELRENGLLPGVQQDKANITR